jgi:prevent-host-death family protein
MVTTSLADVRRRFSHYVQSAASTHERVFITKRGRPVAVLMSIADLDSLEETNAILSDPQLMREMREAEAEVARGETVPGEQVRAEFERRRKA